MAIDLGTLQTKNNGKFVVDLEKGFKVDLEKDGKSLKHLTFAAGWDKATVLPDVDIDIQAIIYVDDVLKNMVYYKNRTGVEGIELGKDNRDGSGEGEDEKMKISLDKISSSINRIRLMVSIFKAQERNQNFGIAKNAFISLHNDDEGWKEEARFNLTSDYSMFTGITIGDLVKNGDTWTFVVIGNGHAGNLQNMVDENESIK